MADSAPTIARRDVVGVILYNPRDEILLQHRDDKPGLPYAGWWTVFGGAVEPGETVDEAIHRELMEELELDLQPLFWYDYDCPIRSIPDRLIVTNHVYTARLDHPVETLTLHEGQGMAWFTRASAPLTLAFAQESIVQRYFQEFSR